MIIFGKRLYGDCDGIHGLGHIATQFVHIWFVPVIPLGSYLVISEQGRSFRGVDLGFDVKSFMLAWLRAALVLATLATLVGAVAIGISAADNHLGTGICLGTVGLLVAVALGACLWVSMRTTAFASPARMRAILAQVERRAPEHAAQFRATVARFDPQKLAEAARAPSGAGHPLHPKDAAQLLGFYQALYPTGAPPPPTVDAPPGFVVDGRRYAPVSKAEFAAQRQNEPAGLPMPATTILRQHYVFAQKTLRAACSDDGAALHALASPSSAEWLRSLWERAGTACPPEGREPPGPLASQTALLDGHALACVSMPPPRRVGEAHFIAITARAVDAAATRLSGVRYFTLELGIDLRGAGRTVLCELSGARHLNYGDGPPPEMQSFMTAVRARLAAP